MININIRRMLANEYLSKWTNLNNKLKVAQLVEGQLLLESYCLWVLMLNKVWYNSDALQLLQVNAGVFAISWLMLANQNQRKLRAKL